MALGLLQAPPNIFANLPRWFLLYCQLLRLVPVTFSAPGVLVCFCLWISFSLTHPRCHLSLRFGSLLATGDGVCDKLFICTWNFVFTELCRRVLAVVSTSLRMAGTDGPFINGARFFLVKRLKITSREPWVTRLSV